MDLHLTSEQTLLRDSAAKFIVAAGPKVARGFREQDPGFAPARLAQAGDLGWLGILVPSSANGLGLGLTELALVLDQAGRGLVCEPIGLAAISAAALAQGHAPHPMLERAMAGRALIVPALQEDVYGDDPLAPRTQVVTEDGTLRLTGKKMFVCADGADGFLVSASGRDGPTLCYVARNAPGCMLAATQTVEGRKLSTLSLKDAPADFVQSRQSSRNAVDALHNLALMALSAELLGVMEKAQEITLDYLRVRKQFGKLIGSFQALQHQAVNIHIRTETTRSLVFQVAANNDPYRIDPALAVAVKAKASEDALFVTKACIQLHGAIGFTDEHDIGLYLKRAMLLSSLFGNAADGVHSSRASVVLPAWSGCPIRASLGATAEGSVLTKFECRKRATECRQMADEADNIHMRDILLDIARSWTRLAVEMDQKSLALGMSRGPIPLRTALHKRSVSSSGKSGTK